MRDRILGVLTPPATQAASQPKVETRKPRVALTPSQERRRNLRARIALPLRVRSADFSDGSLEQVSATQNTSRKGFYFHTASDRYYPGMRLRITFPYHGTDTVGETEEYGEVVRVDKKTNSYGVAITLSASPALQGHRPGADLRSSEKRYTAATERRVQKRFPFVATAEIVEARSEQISRAHTSDLSLSGCYIDTMNPLPLGTTFDLWIEKANEKFEARASVATQHQGSGMGIVFKDLTPEQSSILVNWLVESAGAASAA